MTKPDKQKTIKRLTYIRDSFGGGRMLEMTNGEYCRYKEHISEIAAFEKKHRAVIDRLRKEIEGLIKRMEFDGRKLTDYVRLKDVLAKLDEVMK